ncbi:MAG: TonB family protein [Blastomonas sp.]
MAYADQQMSGSKLTSIIIVAIIHVVVGYALVTGLAYSAVKKAAEVLDVVDVEEEVPEEPEELPPPPPDQPLPPPPVVSPPPIVQTPSPPPPIRTVATPPPVFVPTPVAAPPPPAPPPPPSQARGASPKGQSRWAARVQSNYPSRAQREEREGTVRVALSIDAEGRVSGCSVTGSSGHADLDSAACDALTRYARFDPALNAAGNPTTGSYSTAVRYQLSR